MKSWLVFPSSPTGNNRRIELAGNDIRSGIGVDNVFVYPSDLNIDRLKDALSHTLSVWPLDSRVVRDTDQGELPAFLDVVQTTKIAHDYPDESLFRLKVTHIVRSDEWVMGTSWSHFLGDGAAYASFLHAFSRFYQEMEPVKPFPIFERRLWRDDEVDRSYLSTMKYITASISSEQRLDVFWSEWAEHKQLNLHFSDEELVTLRKLVVDSTVTIHDVLIAYVILTLNTHCFSKNEQLILRNNMLVNYRGVSDSIAPSNLVGNCILRVWSNDFDDPHSLSNIATSIRQSINLARDPEFLEHWLATTNELIRDMARHHRAVIWARFPNGIVVNSNFRYDWASLVDFGHTSKCRFYTHWSKNLFLRVFRLNPIYNAMGWVERDCQGAEVSFRIEKNIKQKYLDAFQRDINENFINIKT